MSYVEKIKDVIKNEENEIEKMKVEVPYLSRDYYQGVVAGLYKALINHSTEVTSEEIIDHLNQLALKANSSSGEYAEGVKDTVNNLIEFIENEKALISQ